MHHSVVRARVTASGRLGLRATPLGERDLVTRTLTSGDPDVALRMLPSGNPSFAPDDSVARTRC